jgi:tetratricopeptide (TPR) repeat protein
MIQGGPYNTVMSDKLPKLQAMLEKQPNDPFLLYGIAMEYKKMKESPRAIEFLDRCIAADPNYCYAYFQRGQVCEMSGDLSGARQSYNDGIAAAKRAGDGHAQSEIEGALSMLE